MPQDSAQPTAKVWQYQTAVGVTTCSEAGEPWSDGSNPQPVGRPGAGNTEDKAP